MRLTGLDRPPWTGEIVDAVDTVMGLVGSRWGSEVSEVLELALDVLQFGVAVGLVRQRRGALAEHVAQHEDDEIRQRVEARAVDDLLHLAVQRARDLDGHLALTHGRVSTVLGAGLSAREASELGRAAGAGRGLAVLKGGEHTSNRSAIGVSTP